MSRAVSRSRVLPFVAAFAFAFVASGCPAAEDGPRLLKCTPADGAKDVPLDVGKLVFVFDRNMNTESHSLVPAGKAPFPPMVPAEEPWQDPVTFILEVKALEPGTTYSIGLNSERRRGFVDAAGKVLAPVVVSFTTRAAGGTEPAAPPAPPETSVPARNPLAKEAPSASPAPEPAPAPGPATNPLSKAPPAPLANPLAKAAPASKPSGLPGEWLFRNDEIEIRVRFHSDGRFERSVRTSEGSEDSSGTCSLSGTRLTVRPEGDEEMQLSAKFIDADTLELTDEGGEGVRLVRQGKAPVGDGAKDPIAARGTAESAESPAPAPAGVSPASGPAGKPVTVVFERRWEPKERAFTILVPKGWTLEGGMFHVDPMQAGGPGNSVDTKCDLLLEKDAAGTYYFRWLPSYNYADLSQGQFALTSGLFPQGSRYQGMEVRPLPTWEGFLQALFQSLHPRASGARVIHREQLPELAGIFQKINAGVDTALTQMGLPASRYDAGGLVIECTEGGVAYHVGLVAAVVDMRGAGAMWSNQYTLATRAPAAESKGWKPVFDIIRTSIKFDPKWVEAAARAAGQRAQQVQETLRYLQRIDREIVENRRKTHADTRYESWLLLTGQEDYVNPYTKEVEVDTNDYKSRWTTASGERLYTDDTSFDPNRDRNLNQLEWKKTAVRKRE